MKRSWTLEMVSNIQRKKFALNVRRDCGLPESLAISYQKFGHTRKNWRVRSTRQFTWLGRGKTDTYEFRRFWYSYGSTGPFTHLAKLSVGCGQTFE